MTSNLHEEFASWYVEQIDKIHGIIESKEIIYYDCLVNFIFDGNYDNRKLYVFKNHHNDYVISDYNNKITQPTNKILYDYLYSVNVPSTICQTLQIYQFFMVNRTIKHNIIKLDTCDKCDINIIKLIAKKCNINHKQSELINLKIIHEKLCQEINIVKKQETNYVAINFDDMQISIETKLTALKQINAHSVKQKKLLKLETEKYIAEKNISNTTYNILNYQIFISITNNNKIDNICEIKSDIINLSINLKKENEMKLKQLFNNVLNNTTDFDIYIINFNFENTISTYKIHSFLLDSLYFISLKNNYTESFSKIINLNIMHDKTGEDFIRYLYLKEVIIDCNEISRLNSMITLADYLIISNLHELCLDILKLNI